MEKDKHDKEQKKQERPIFTTFRALEEGRLAEMTYDKNREHHEMFSIYNPTDGSVVDSVFTFDGGKCICPLKNDDLILKKTVLLPTKAEAYGTERDLFDSVRKFIHKYIGVPESHERLASLYVPFSWVYDCFTVLPYLRALGDFGTGKSRYLQVVGSICYKPLPIVAAVGVAPLFRSIQRYGGTLILDEANFKDSEVTAAIMQILNAGYEKRSAVIRCDDKNYEKVISCQVFGPKILSSRAKYKDLALESRCITWESEPSERIQSVGQEKKEDEIPLYLGETFDQEAASLRNQLLMFRFRHYGMKTIDPKRLHHPVEPRISQILLPLANMTDDTVVLEDINALAKEMNKQRAEDRSGQVEARILQAIYDLDGGRGEKHYFKAICEKYNADLMDEDRKMTPQSLSYFLKKPELRIPTEKKDEWGRSIVCNPERMSKLYLKFGISEEKLTTDGSDEPIQDPPELSAECDIEDLLEESNDNEFN